MAEITAKLVRELRDRTGAPMMDCKKALEATGGDIEAATDHLRKAGLKTADKKAGRDTDDGLVNAKIGESGKVGAMVAVSCETDFVAKTPDFGGFITSLTDHVAEHGPANVEELLGQPWQGGPGTVEDARKDLIAKLTENIQVANAVRMQNDAGYVATYIHHNQKVGVLVSVSTGAEKEKAEPVLRDLTMHIAFAKPDGLSRDEISPEAVEREKAIYMDEVKNKPEEIQEKIVGGKLDKFFAGRILPEQPWVKDDKISVQKALEQALGADSKIEAFACYVIGG